jgi:autotransporter-associated beta strand protein
LQFSGTTKTLTNSDFSAASNFGAITFNAGAGPFVLSGNSIVLNGIVTNSSWSLQTINLNLDLNGAVRTFSTGVMGPNGANTGILGDLAVSGVISNGGLTKTNANSGANAGKLTLTGVNTYTGVTTISYGTLSVATIGDGGVAGNLGAASSAATNLVFNAGLGGLQYTGASASTNRNFTINAGANASFDITANNLTLTGASAATSGILSKAGVGTLTLTRAMLNTGATAVNSGKLALDFSATGAPSGEILNSGNVLSFGNTIAAGGMYGGSATLEIKGGVAANTQTFGSLIVAPQGSMAGHLNLVGGTAPAPITVNFASFGTFSSSGNLSPTLDISKGTSDVVHFTTATVTNGLIAPSSGTVGITLNGTDWAMLDGSNNVIAATYTNNVFAAANNVNVTASTTTGTAANTLRFDTAAPVTLTYNGTADTRGILETANVGANAVTINATSAANGFFGNRSIPIIQNNTLGDMTIDSAIQNGNGGVENISKSGAGRLILSGTNNYNGSTFVNEGILQISSNSNIGSVASGNNLNSPQAGNLILSSTLEARGGSNIVLDGQGGVSGIYARALLLGSGAPVIDVDAGTTLTISGGIDATNSSIPLSGALTKNNAGTLVLSGVNNSTGGLIVNAGTVQATYSSGGVTVPTVTPQGVVFASGSAANQLNFTSNSTTINMSNASTAGIGGGALATGQLITGAGIAAGTTITGVSGSTITISAATTAASSSSYNLYLNATSATFASGVTSITVGSAAGIQVGQLVTGINGIAFGTVVTGVSGTTITLNQATTAANGAGNQYAFGGVSQYAVSSTAGLALGASSVGQGLRGNINGIQGNIVSDTFTNNGGNFNVSNLVFGAADSLGFGSVTVNGGTLDLGGIAHQPLGAVTMTGGTIQNGTLQGNSYTAAIASGNATVSANLAGSSSVGLTKSGAGTLTLSGNNTYSGGTTVSVGTLLVNNTIGSGTGTGSVTVNGGTLGGNGTIGGAVTISAGGTLSPGNSPGLLTIDGPLTLNGSVVMEIAGATRGTTYDAVDIGASQLLTYGGTLTLTMTAAIADGTYDLFSFTSGSKAGSFTSIAFSGGYYTGTFTQAGDLWTSTLTQGQIFTFDQTSGDLISAIPEPSTWILLALSLTTIVILRRRRRVHD